MTRSTLRFTGRIAGFGTTAGPRVVVGMWRDSPFGAFTDVMLQRADGHRMLFAPNAGVAEFVAATYAFDEVRVAPVRAMPVRRRGAAAVTRDDAALRVTVGREGDLDLDLRVRVGGISPLGRLLRLVPSAFATRPVWLRAVDPVARVLVPGARTAGSAGGGRREYYGVTNARRIVEVVGTVDGADVGALAPLDPPVTFGFGSAPASPHLVDVVTTIR